MARTFPAAISRSAVTISRLSESTSGLAPFKSCRARSEAIITSSKRLETLSKQSSTVILAIASTVGSAVAEHKDNLYRDKKEQEGAAFIRLSGRCAPILKRSVCLRNDSCRPNSPASVCRTIHAKATTVLTFYFCLSSCFALKMPRPMSVRSTFA